MTAPDHYAVLGNPVSHSRSPWIHARFAALTGQNLRYERELVPLDAFAATVRTLHAAGLRGCNVTVPFKFEAAALATRQTPEASLAQAANTLRWHDGELLAHNTDGLGLVRDLTEGAGLTLRGARILLLGAGGAAAGVLGALLRAQPARLVLLNRHVERAHTLCQRHAELAMLQKVELTAQDQQALAGKFDVIVNATAASLQGTPLLLDGRWLSDDALVYDMMYGAAARPFLDGAARLGARTRDGLGMLVQQAAASFELWRGITPPATQVLAELRALVDAGS